MTSRATSTPRPARQPPDLLHGVDARGVHGSRAIALRQGELLRRAIDREHLDGSECLRELDGRHPQPADAEDGDALARPEPRLAQRVERRRGGAHQGGSLLEGDLGRQCQRVARRHRDVLRVTAVRVVPEHEPVGAELLVARAAVPAVAAREVVVQDHAVARLQPARRAAPDLLDDTRDLVTQGHRQGPHGRGAGPVVDVRVADACRLHLHQHVTVPDGRHGHVEQLERFSHGHHADCLHGGECGFLGGAESRSPTPHVFMAFRGAARYN